MLLDLQELGYRTSRKRVARLMREEGLVARQRRRFRGTTESDHDEPVAPNLLHQDFAVEGLDLVWVGDITYVPTREGWLYLAFLLDLSSRYVVGWSTAESLEDELTLAALDRALETRRPAPGLIHHSDRGSQYASYDYRKKLAERGVIASMSRRGNCYDNAAMESWFSTLKSELGEVFESPAQAKAALFDYIEVFYNQQRRHSALGYLSPAEFERMQTHQAAA